MERTIVSMKVTVNGGKKQKVQEEVNDNHSPLPVLASALTSVLQSMPIGVGANKVTVAWEYTDEEDAERTFKDKVEVDLYRSSIIPDVSDHIAGKIIRGINREQHKFARRKMDESFEEVMQAIDNDEDLSDKEKAMAKSKLEMLQGITSMFG